MQSKMRERIELSKCNDDLIPKMVSSTATKDDHLWQRVLSSILDDFIPMDYSSGWAKECKTRERDNMKRRNQNVGDLRADDHLWYLIHLLAISI